MAFILLSKRRENKQMNKQENRIEIDEIGYQMGLASAEGYYGLGMHNDSWKELDRLNKCYQYRMEVLVLRSALLLKMGHWRQAENLAEAAQRIFTDVPEFYVHHALALEQQGKLEAAKDAWFSSPDEVRKSSAFHYNVARCDAGLGNWESVRSHLKAAFSIDPKLVEDALREPGFKSMKEQVLAPELKS